MGLPSSNLNAPLFAPTPTNSASHEYGNASAVPSFGADAQNPVPSPLSELMAQANPQHLPPFTGGELEALKSHIGGMAHGYPGMFPFQL